MYLEDDEDGGINQYSDRLECLFRFSDDCVESFVVVARVDNQLYNLLICYCGTD